MNRLRSQSTFASLATATILTVLAPLAPAAIAIEARPAIKIFLSDPGVYRVAHADLVAAGWPADELASSRLHLRHGERPVPIAVEDGGDGRFGAGDAVLFAGDRLAGEHGYLNEYSSLNVYWLEDDPSRPAGPADRLQAGDGRRAATDGDCGFAFPLAAARPSRRGSHPAALSACRHGGSGALVLDEALLPRRRPVRNRRRPFGSRPPPADVAGGAGAESSAVEITVEVRGWSRPRTKPSPEFADHAVEVLWNGAVVGRREWSGTEQAETIAVRLPSADVQPGIHRLALRVPERPAADNQPLVDVSILNWIEIVAPRMGALAAGPALATPAPDEPLASGARQYRIEPRPAGRR